jgi:hypothetical protein
MKENQKDQTVVTNNKSDQKKQWTSPNANTKTKTDNKFDKPTTMVDEEENDEQTPSRKEHEDKEHQHDYKTPVGTQNKKDEKQGVNQTKSSTNVNKEKSPVLNTADNKTKQK